MIRSVRLITSINALIIALQLSVSPAAGATGKATDAFDAANLLYEKGKFVEAVEAYESLIAGGTRTAPLLFNLGNAYYKTEETGLAISSWLQAESLAPRNERIQINLDFARNAVGGGATPLPRWQDLLKRFTLNEWTGVVLSTSWLFFGGLALGVWRPKWRPPLRLAVLIGGVLFVVSTALLIITARDRAETVVAVVTVEEAVIRFGPLKESQSAFVARDGTEFRAIDFKEDWIRVIDSTDREGWLTSDQVILLRGGRPLVESDQPDTSGPN